MDGEHSGQDTAWPHIPVKSSTGLNPAEACIPIPFSQFPDTPTIAAMCANFSGGYLWNKV
jgi:hypothetical protein